MKTIAIILVFYSVAGYSSTPLDTTRTPGGLGSWHGLVGVPGGIPQRTIYTTISAGASSATIQSAVDNCPSNQVVQLSAGSYNLGGNSINIENNGVTLRGAGPAQTHLTNTGHPSVQIGNWQWWNTETIDNPSAGNHVNWTSGYTQGLTNITIANASGYSVGQIIVLDQLNDADTDAAGNSSNGAYAGYQYTSIAYPTDGHNRYQFQVNRIFAINGSSITLTEPLYMPNWSSSLSPQAWRFSTKPVVFSGVENLEVADAVQIHVGYGCWFSNVTCHVGTTGHDGVMRPYWSVRCTIEHCYMDADVTGLDTYGIESRACAGLLIQNNIGNKIGTPLTPCGCSGSVWAYNVMTNVVPFYPVILHGLLQHGGNPNMNLYEGNFCPSIGFDNTWGSSAYNVAFRNRARGFDTTGNDVNQYAFCANITNRHCASIGNVLGTTGLNTWYEDYGGQSGGCHENGGVYYLGFFDVGCQEPHDTISRSTLIRAYNWTSATATNSGIAADGYLSSDIPASYYLASKPAFFGFLTYPAVDPTAPAYSSSWTNIPAGYRAVFGVDPPAAPDAGGPVAAVSLGASTMRANNGTTLRFSQ